MERTLNPFLLVLLMLVYACSSQPPRQVIKSKPIYFVVADEMDIRAAPHIDAKILETLELDKQIEVYEFNNDRSWVRISDYFDGKNFGLPGRVAKWAPMAQLGERKKTAKIVNVIKVDPRILSVPDEESSGLTKQQIAVLIKGAEFFLQNGKCKAVDTMDYNNGKWSITCTGAKSSIYFNPLELGIPVPN